MIGDYLLRLAILLPLVAGLAYASLWLWRKLQPGMMSGARERLVRVVDVLPMGTSGRLAVIEFSGRHLLVAVSRGRFDLLADSPLVSVSDDD
jgi:flagellar protein FliO/FliZ